MNTRDFAKEHHVTATYERAGMNPHVTDPTWKARHYKVVLAHPKYHGGYFSNARLTTYFSKGMGLPDGVEVEEVLDALASDAASIDNARGFEDWASDFGYPTVPPGSARTFQQARDYGYEKEWTEYRRARKSYTASIAMAKKLKQFLSDDGLYEKLLYHTDRL